MQNQIDLVGRVRSGAVSVGDIVVAGPVGLLGAIASHPLIGEAVGAVGIGRGSADGRFIASISVGVLQQSDRNGVDTSFTSAVQG